MKNPIRIHPGEILREEFMRPLGLSAKELALALRVPVGRVDDIVHEHRAITPDTAIRLGRFFGTSAHFWMNLQNTHNLFQLEDRLAEELSRIRPHGSAESATAKHPA